MTKIAKQQYKDQAESSDSKVSNINCLRSNGKPKRNLKMFKHKDYVYGNEYRGRALMTARREDSSNSREKCSENRVTSVRKGRETVQKYLPVYDTELNTSVAKQNGNKINSNCKEIVASNSNGRLSSVSESTKGKAKSVSCDLCTDSFSSKKALHHHKKKVHISGIAIELRRKGALNALRRASSEIPKKQKDEEVVRAESQEKVLKYFQKKRTTDQALTNINLMNRTHMVISEQRGVTTLENKRSSSVTRIQTSEKVTQESLHTNGTQLNEQESEVVSATKIAEDAVESKVHKRARRKRRSEFEQIIGEGNEMGFSDFYKKTFMGDTVLQDRVSKSGEDSSLRPLENRVRTRSMTRLRKLEGSVKDLSHVTSASHAPEAKAIKPESINSRSLNKSRESISEFSFKSCDNKGKVDDTVIPRIIQVERKTVFERNLQTTTHVHSTSNALSCNLCDSTFPPNKALNEHRNEGHAPRKRSLKPEESKNVGRPALQTNSPTLVDMQIRKEDKYEINKSVTVVKSTKSVPKEMKEPEILKVGCNVQVNETDQQEVCDISRQHEHCAVETVEKEYFGKAVKRRGSRNSSKFDIVRAAKDNREVNRNVAMPENFTDNKQLTISLTKVENFPSSELLQMIRNPNCMMDGRRSEEKRKVYRTKDIVQMQCSVRKLYKNTQIKTDEGISVKNKSLRYESHSEDNLFGKKVKKQIVSIHQYNEETLEEKISENESLSPQINEKPDKYGLPSSNEVSKTATLQNDISKLENIVNFFLEHKKKAMNGKAKRRSRRSNLKTLEEYRVRRSVAMCTTCKQVFNLLLQFSSKINFVKDEKLCIECTLCGLQIYSLSHFQQHIMDIHLQCKGVLATRGEQFTVDIINLNEHLSLNDKDKFIFECCCCLKIFNSMKYFENHVRKIHRNFNYSKNNIEKYGGKKLIETSELYEMYKHEQIFNPMFDVTNNAAKVSNQDEKSVVQTSNCINEYYYNSKEINLKNNTCYTNLNKVKCSSITHITQRVSQLESSVEDLNNGEEYSKLNNSLYVCDICSKCYKRKGPFLVHMSKHEISPDTNTSKEQEIQGLSQNNNMINFESNAVVPNVHIEDAQDCSENCKINNVVNSVVTSRYLEEPKCNISMSSEISEETNNAKNENAEDIVEEENTPDMDNALDCNYILHVNLAQKSRGVKRQKSIKCNINITKKCKTNDTEEEIVDSEIGNEFPINYQASTDFTLNSNRKEAVTYLPKEVRCDMCDKRFNSKKVLKEHMFFLHDSIFDGTELTNLLTPYFNNLYITENMPSQSIDMFRKECNASPSREMSRMLLKKNKETCQSAISNILSNRSTTERSRKWRCNPCKENFALIRNYLRHKYYCHNDESVVHICDNCNKVLTSVAMVNIHICTNVTSWNCQRCDLSFTNGISLTQHNVSCHFEIPGPHVCDVCNLSFLTMYMLERHNLVHSMIGDSSDVNNSTDLSVESNIPHSLSDTNSPDIRLPEENTQLINDKGVSYVNSNTKNLNGTSETVKLPLDTCINSNVISLPCDDDELFKCKLCNIICLTKTQMKFHLEKWHSIEVEICKVCNDLYTTDEITKHLISRHIVLDDSDFKEDNINIRMKYERMEDFQNDIARILGLNRLLSLYEYQRFDNIPENKCFNCVTCLKEFSSVQSYKIHYLKCHDEICLLCNIKFKHNFQAFEHKIKIHISVDSYLWVTEKIIAATLEFNEHGNTMEDVILRCSEIRMSDEEKHFANEKEQDSMDSFQMEISEYYWLMNYQFEKLDANKEFLYTVEKFQSSAELSENVNTSIIIIDHSNYKNLSVLSNCE